MKRGLVAVLAVCVLFLVIAPSLWAEVVRGKITTVDLVASKLAVQTSSGEALALAFDKEDFIVWKGDDEVEAKEIQIGSEAEVGYYADENGAKIASWVDLTPLEATEEPSAAVEGMAPETGAAAMEQPTMAQPETMESPSAEEPATQEQPGN